MWRTLQRAAGGFSRRAGPGSEASRRPIPITCDNKNVRLQIARAAAILLLAGRCFPQASSTISLSNGLELRIAANLGQPTGEETLHIEMHRASGDSFYRIFRDQNNLAVFAYELAVRRVGSDAVS